MSFLGQKLKLVFEKSNKLVDDNFVYIERDGNSSRLIENYHKLASKYDDCFYRNINSALEICEGNIVSTTVKSPRLVKFKSYFIERNDKTTSECVYYTSFTRTIRHKITHSL